MINAEVSSAFTTSDHMNSLFAATAKRALSPAAWAGVEVRVARGGRGGKKEEQPASQSPAVLFVSSLVSVEFRTYVSKRESF